jgi:2-polyprenyl-3-methyl-5-hydroxy-6-metoxy-1,4-benzoquinol methylase
MLDVGCGTGLSSRPFAQYFEKVVAVDVSKSQIEEAKKSSDDFSNVVYK